MIVHTESPRRRGTRLRWLLSLALPLTACGGDDQGLDPNLRAPATGTYQYDALVHTSDSLPPDTLSGELEISASSEDSVIATWSVPGFSAAPVRGTWNINAYTLPANPTSFQGDVTHRIWRQASSENLSCTLNYERIDMPADTFTSSSANRCTLVR